MESKEKFTPQRSIVYNKFLPFSKSLEEEAYDFHLRIKANLSRSLLLSDAYSIKHWIFELKKFVDIYGLSFTKHDHLFFIHLLLEVIKLPDIEYDVLSTAFSALINLLSKRRLISRDELTINWRPLYNLHNRMRYSSEKSYGLIHTPASKVTALEGVIELSRVYFSVDSTQEMLDEWRPWLCPFSQRMVRAMFYLNLFLPTLMKREEHAKGYKLWLQEFLAIWEANQNSASWEQFLVTLFARLANDTIGLTDWKPWVPKLFTWLMRSVDLKGGAHMVTISGHCPFLSSDFCKWIVSMLGGTDTVLVEDHIQSFFKALESYFYPTNDGTWTETIFHLMYSFPSVLIRRIHWERIRKKSWEPAIPRELWVTDQVIERMVTTLLPIAMIGLFSPSGGGNAVATLHCLAILRPDLVIPPLLQKLDASLYQLCEPDRFETLIGAVNAVAFNLINGNDLYREGQLKVIPLLMSILPGIDYNDIDKCTATLEFISTCASIIPFVDCSQAVQMYPDLSDAEKELCTQTALFEDFVVKFLERCFLFVESSRSEQKPEGADNNINDEELTADTNFHQAIGTALGQCSPELYAKAIDKIFDFLSKRILETKTAGSLATSFFDTFSFVNTEIALQKFVPHFTRIILSLTEEEDVFTAKEVDSQLFSTLLLFSSFESGGHCLLSYKQEIVQVLERTIRFTNKQAYKYGGTFLNNTLTALTTCYPKSYLSLAKPWTGLRDDLPIYFWGKCEDIEKVSMEWHIPSEEEMDFAKTLLEKFMFQPLKALVSWSQQTTVDMKKEEVRRSLFFISHAFTGASCAFPTLPGEDCTSIDKLVEFNSRRIGDIGTQPISFPSIPNVREYMVTNMRVILKHVQSKREDDTKSLTAIVSILNELLFYWGFSGAMVVYLRGLYESLKSSMYSWNGKKVHPRIMHMLRIYKQYIVLITNKAISPFTSIHKDIIQDLVILSTSHYIGVRINAQEVLFNIETYYDFSHREVVSSLVKYIEKDSKEPYERIKGSIHLIVKLDLPNVTDFETAVDICLAVINMVYSERQGMVRIMDTFRQSIDDEYVSSMLTLPLMGSCSQLAKGCWSLENGLVPSKFKCPSEKQISAGVKADETRNEANIGHYHRLVSGLVEAIDEGSLHWKYLELAIALLKKMIRWDVELPEEAVNVFVTHLTHETLVIRKECIECLGSILRQQKQIHSKRLLTDFERKDNKWLQYNRSLDYSKKSVWEATTFVEKDFWGFYCWPKQGLTVYCPQQPNVNRTLDQVSDVEKPILSRFLDKEFVDKLILLLALEENKGSDCFDGYRFKMFKGLFRNFGSVLLDMFAGHLKALVEVETESHQVCASEVLAGIVRGTKHWHYEDAMKAKHVLVPLIRTAFKNMTSETYTDWGTCCSTSFSGREARKLSWFVDVLIEANVQSSSSKSSFLASSQLYCLMGALMQQKWRTISLWDKLLTFICEGNHMNHSLPNVRNRIAGALNEIFDLEAPYQCLPETLSNVPKSCAFIDRYLPEVKKLHDPEAKVPNKTPISPTFFGRLFKWLKSWFASDSTSEHHTEPIREDTEEIKAAKNVFKTLCQWIILSIASDSCSEKIGFYKLLPFMCESLRETRNPHLREIASSAAGYMSHLYLTPEYAKTALNTSLNISKSSSWRSRIATPTILLFLVSTNLFTVNEIKTEVTSIIYSLMRDKRVEIRENAAEALTGYFHYHFIEIDDNLIDVFRLKSETRLRREGQVSLVYNETDLIERHFGILGLCATINAYPFDVPPFMPQVLHILNQHESDPLPISKTIKETLLMFRKTHQDNWREHRDKFTEVQLTEINDNLVSANYYA